MARAQAPSTTTAKSPRSRRLLRPLGATFLVLAVAMIYGEPVYWAVMDRHAAPSLSDARSWCYQLFSIDRAALRRADCGMLVTYPLSDDKRPLTTADVRLLKHNAGGRRRVVLAYLSVGEAEAYREYWRAEWLEAPPWWVAGRNPAWRGAYRVRYWAEEWQSMVFASPNSLLSRIIEAGFDGVFLDNVDVYDHFSAEQPDAAGRMAGFVAALARTARRQRPGFLVVPQNGEELLLRPDYVATIDAIAKEDLVFGVNGDETRNSADDLHHSLSLLRRMTGRRKPVFVVEYVSDRARTSEALAIARGDGFIPAIATRLLDKSPLQQAQEAGQGETADGARSARRPR